jgi:hypothetical protein
MRFVIRGVAVLTAISVAFTVWFIVAFAVNGGVRPLLATGALGVLTVAGWIVSLVAGPIAAVRLWRLHEPVVAPVLCFLVVGSPTT